MRCEITHEDRIGYLYDEIDDARRAEIDTHVRDCADCRASLHALRGTREFLHEHASPVPLAPRLVVLRPRPRASFWTFAAGLAAATVVFSLGLGVGMLGEGAVRGAADDTAGTTATATATGTIALDGVRDGSERIDALPVSQLLTREELQQALQDQRAWFDRQLAATRSAGTPETQNAYLTRSDFQDALRNLETSFDRRRSNDFNFIMDELTAIETRAVNELQINRQLMGVVLVDQDPRFREQ